MAEIAASQPPQCPKCSSTQVTFSRLYGTCQDCLYSELKSDDSWYAPEKRPDRPLSPPAGED